MRKFDLQLFWTPHVDAGTYEIEPINVTTQTTTGEDMSPTMKTFYGTSLLENAREKMVFTQMGKKQPFKGKTIEWRKWNTFDKAMTPLTEGVIPSGQKFGMTAIVGETTQHGDYTAISDRLEMEAYDDVIFGATEEMGAAEGETYDTLTRNILVAGNSVVYAPKIVAGVETPVTQRSDLDNTAILTPKLVAQIVTWLKKSKAPTFEGNTYAMIIHPSQAYDLRATDEWKDFHKYADVNPIFSGEIGTLHGMRFIESNNTKVYRGAGATYATYAALAFGKDAFGVLEPAGEGMELIIKDRGTIGGPLNQFSTVGYKFNHGAKILYQERMLRVETGSYYSDIDTAN